MPTDLPASLAKLYAPLAGGEEVHLIKLYECVLGQGTNNQRHAQQTLGSYITKLNRRLKGEGKKIVPGGLKGTYVLCDEA
jgi:hypothetical protein